MSKTIGQRIRELRGRREFTQTKLAQLIGCAPNTIAAWESSNGQTPHKRFLGKLAQALGVSTDYLFGIANQERPQVPCYGEVYAREFIWPKIIDPAYYIDVPQKEYSSSRFSLKILDDLLEPIINQEDYGIFEKLLPKDNDIVIVRFPKEHNKAVVRMWRQQGKSVMLCETNVYKGGSPYFFEITQSSDEDLSYVIKEQPKHIIIEGKLVVVKRVLKSVKVYPTVSYIFS